MKFIRALTTTFAAAAVVAACADAPTSPAVIAGEAQRTFRWLPGSERGSSGAKAQFKPVNCSPKEASYGKAMIGPPGGTLFIGKHRLIVPPGALRRWLEISGTVPAGRPFEVDLQPHGLQFRKAAGLILDASSCIDVPSIVYLIDQYTTSPPILALYSNWWHTIACPIWHFSGYAIAFGRGSEEDASSTQ